MLAYADYIRVKKFHSNDAVSGVQRTTFDVYSYMDRIVANRNDYTFTLAANSSRMCTEYGNSENNLGRYEGQGYTQIYLDDINQYNEDYSATVDQKNVFLELQLFIRIWDLGPQVNLPGLVAAMM